MQMTHSQASSSSSCCPQEGCWAFWGRGRRRDPVEAAEANAVRYTVIHEQGLPVTSTYSRNSEQIRTLSNNEAVEVLEDVMREIDSRVRAPIRPNGWITLRMADGTHIFAIKESAANSPDNLPSVAEKDSLREVTSESRRHGIEEEPVVKSPDNLPAVTENDTAREVTSESRGNVSEEFSTAAKDDNLRELLLARESVSKEVQPTRVLSDVLKKHEEAERQQEEAHRKWCEDFDHFLKKHEDDERRQKEVHQKWKENDINFLEKLAEQEREEAEQRRLIEDEESRKREVEALARWNEARKKLEEEQQAWQRKVEEDLEHLRLEEANTKALQLERRLVAEEEAQKKIEEARRLQEEAEQRKASKSQQDWCRTESSPKSDVESVQEEVKQRFEKVRLSFDGFEEKREPPAQVDSTSTTPILAIAASALHGRENAEKLLIQTPRSMSWPQGLTTSSLHLESHTFDPTSSTIREQLLTHIGARPDTVITTADKDFCSSSHEGIWFLREPFDLREELVLKSILGFRRRQEFPTEAESLMRLYEEYPSIAEDTSLSFPFMIVHVFLHQTLAYDLMLMRKPLGKSFPDHITLKSAFKQMAKLQAILEKVGVCLRRFHDLYGGQQHGDFQPSNIYYDEQTDRVTLANLSGIGAQKTKSDREHFVKSLRLYNSHGPALMVEGLASFDRGYTSENFPDNDGRS